MGPLWRQDRYGVSGFDLGPHRCRNLGNTEDHPCDTGAWTAPRAM